MSASSLPQPFNGGGAAPGITQQLPTIPSSTETNSSPSSNFSSIIIVIIIIAAAIIVSVGIYLLRHFFSRRFRHSFRTTFSPEDVVSRRDSSLNEQLRQTSSSNSLLESLPLFTFNSVSGNLTGGDCAVCLSKFEPHDQLRLLPLCCHAFHAECIDTWIVSNQTCPLCRSMVLPSDSDVLDKIQSMENPRSNRDGNSGSFRIEIGSISRRHGGAMAEAVEGMQRSYSIGGSFEYIVDDNGYEVSVGSTTHRRGISDCNSVDKESSFGIPVPAPPGEALAAEVAGGRNWLRDYVDRLASASVSVSSRAMSFRGSGRFFSGSSRRNDPVIAPEDLEANRVGEEISELFRWLSGI